MPFSSKSIIDNTPGGKILTTGLGISATLASIALIAAAGFFIYGRYLDTKLTKLQIEQLKRELGITDETLVDKLTRRVPVTIL